MAEPVSLKCPNCGSVLRAEDLDPANGIIRCGYCQALSTLPQVQAPGPGVVGFRPRPEVPLPPGLKVEDRNGVLVVTRRWFSAVVFFLIPFCIGWNAFLIFWYGIAFSGHAPWIMKVFPIAHVAVGVGLTYFVIATLFNRTQIATWPGKLRVAHGPLPWPGGVELAGGEIEQLYGKMRTTRGQDGPTVGFELWAVLRDGTSRKLLGTGFSEEQVLYLEQRLERALGIKDRAVPGELPRG